MRKEFRTAQQDLRDSDEHAIHEARKSVKKTRAILRLLQTSLGSAYDSENTRLRRAARSLSALRDLDAMTETLRSLQDRHSTVLTASIIRPVTRGLRGRTRHVRSRASLLVSKAKSALDKSDRSAPDRVRSAARFSAVRDGVAHGYRRARKAMQQVTAESNDADVHAWRRKVKDHWYHVRLFEGLHATPRARARRLRQLERWLGDDHDLAFLKTTILHRPDHFGDARATATVLGCIAKDQASLRRRALALGHRLFADKSRQFPQSLKAWWNGSPSRQR